MIIGVTDSMGDAAKFQKYITWLRGGTGPVECRVLSYARDDAGAADDCDGILLTGGGDVDPAIYGARSDHPKLSGVDGKRDEFERGILDRALKAGIPLLGICRGLQLANVHLGGTLIPDLGEAGYTGHQGGNNSESEHAIDIERGALHTIAQASRALVTSKHHQAADKPGDGLRISARAPDGVVEAMEFGDPERKPFFLLVQWHPERTKDPDHPLSGAIRRRFIEAVRAGGAAHENSRRRQNGT